MVLIDNQVHWPLCYGSLVAGAGFEPASQVYETCGLPLSHPASKLVHVGGFEPPVFTAMGHSFTGCCRRRWATHAWRSATESNSHPSHEPPGSGRLASPLAVRSYSKLAVAARVERASPEGTSRFERDGLSHCPTLPLAVGAGLEPAHALRREPRLRRGAIPFRSSYRYKHLAETIRFERMVPSRALRVSSAAP